MYHARPRCNDDINPCGLRDDNVAVLPFVRGRLEGRGGTSVNDKESLRFHFFFEFKELY